MSEDEQSNDERSLIATGESDIIINWDTLTAGLRETHADWLPFLVFGMPYVKIADIFGVDKSAITQALKRDRRLATAVALGRKMVKRQLHYLWLDQKAVQAWKAIDTYLNIDPFEKDDNGSYIYETADRRLLYAERGKMIRFVLQQLGLPVKKVDVMHSTPQPMFMGDQGLAELIVSRIESIGDLGSDGPPVIEAEFKEIGVETPSVLPGDDLDESEIKPQWEKRSIMRGYYANKVLDER